MARLDLDGWITERLTEALDRLGWRVEATEGGAVAVRSDAGDVLFLASGSQLPEEAPGSAPCILVGDEPSGGEGDPGPFDVLPEDASGHRVARAVANAIEVSRLRRLERDQQAGLRRRDYELGQLVEIGKSLGAVKDVDALLSTILEKARFLAGADAGSIYIVEGDAEPIQDRQLRFKLSQNDSLDYASKEFVMPVSTDSIAGAAVVMKQSINIPDVREIPQEAPYGFDASFDERTGYNTRSVLAVPMINQHDDVLGVVQLINKKRNPSARLAAPQDFEQQVVPMDARSQELVETLASQAGVAMENALLYAEIQHIFNGFVRASVHAIEQRDPTTSGHSFRVATLTRGLAATLNEVNQGRFAGVRFGEDELHEIEVAGLLHDFGKVGVREEVLVKAKKLYPPSLKMIRARFDFIRRSIENDHLHRRLMEVENGAPEDELSILDQARERAVAEIEDCWRVISSANEPTVLPEGDFDKIEEIAQRSYFDLGGKRQQFLESAEVEALQVARGSLTPEELDEIRSHASHTISFLKQVNMNQISKN